MSESKSSKKSVNKAEKKRIKWWVILLIVLGILLLIAGLILILFKKGIIKSKKKKNIENNKNDNVSDQSVTSILKGELYENDETTTYNLDDFKNDNDSVEDFELEKTKEFDIRDFDKKE